MSFEVAVGKLWEEFTDLNTTNGLLGKKAGLGCMRSLVQIQSRRPIQVPVITGKVTSSQSLFLISISANKCSKRQVNSAVAVGELREPSRLQRTIFTRGPRVRFATSLSNQQQFTSLRMQR